MNLSKLLNDVERSGLKAVVYGFGIAGKWLSAILQDRGFLLGIVDTDTKKWGVTFLDTIVTSPDCLPTEDRGEFILINTVIDVQDVIDTLQRISRRDSIALGLYLDDLDHSDFLNWHPNLSGESTDFLRYSLEAVKVCHQGYYSKDKLFLRSIDVMITEKCSLKCLDCSNLMQYYQNPQNITFQEVAKQLDQLLERIDHLFEVRLIGGEPFMNRDIYRFMEYLIPLKKVSRIVVYSNAMIPIDLSRRDILSNPKIVFSLTNYGPLAKNTQRVVEQLSSVGAYYRLHPPENWTDSGVIYDFQRTREESRQLFSDCCGKNLLTLSNGKIYRCPFAANADRLAAIPKDSANAVDVSAESDAIRRYCREIDYLPACNFCKGRSFNAPSIKPARQIKIPINYERFENTP